MSLSLHWETREYELLHDDGPETRDTTVFRVPDPSRLLVSSLLKLWSVPCVTPRVCHPKWSVTTTTTIRIVPTVKVLLLVVEVLHTEGGDGYPLH